jgi:DNA (cytosine-5)-methyltransferase 1
MSEREKAWKTRELKLGSLFDGSGGFPLAGVLNGIEPVWASEIEPFPIRVTKARFPNMKHLGDVTKICGAEIEPVDICSFGSPCQDLSTAGKQLGIHDGQRSNLFFEAIRIIKEMREHDRAIGRADDDVRPRFAVWENVPGAFSSNKGADFQAVLQAFCDIKGAGITVPMPSKGKWNHAGCIVGDGFSVAWRVYDAQYWGVPQRRKRIYLIADFGSERAGEILFECEGVYGNPAKGRETWKGVADDAEGSAGRSGEPICLNFQGNKGGCSTTQDGTAYSLNAMHGHDVHVIADKVGSAGRGRAFGVDCYNQTLALEKSIPIRAAASDADHVGAVCYAIDKQGGKGNASYQTDVTPTLCSDSHGTPHAVALLNCTHPEPICLNDQGGTIMDVSDKAMTLRAQEHGHQPIACYAVDCRNMQANEEISSVWESSSLSVFDARGNGDGETVPTITGDHNGHISDYTCIFVERKTDG